MFKDRMVDKKKIILSMKVRSESYYMLHDGSH